MDQVFTVGKRVFRFWWHTSQEVIEAHISKAIGRKWPTKGLWTD